MFDPFHFKEESDDFYHLGEYPGCPFVGGCDTCKKNGGKDKPGDPVEAPGDPKPDEARIQTVD